MDTSGSYGSFYKSMKLDIGTCRSRGGPWEIAILDIACPTDKNVPLLRLDRRALPDFQLGTRAIRVALDFRTRAPTSFSAFFPAMCNEEREGELLRTVITRVIKNCARVIA